MIPADPRKIATRVNETNLAQVQGWLTSLGYHSAYVVFSRSMDDYADYFGAPADYSN